MNRLCYLRFSLWGAGCVLDRRYQQRRMALQAVGFSISILEFQDTAAIVIGCIAQPFEVRNKRGP